MQAAEEYLFQFHSGSIKSRTTRRYPLVYSGFNSIVVRLKEVEKRKMGDWKFGFNSIVVRLKASNPCLTPSRTMGFNSIVVRLKEKVLRYLFAFLKVSIP